MLEPFLTLALRPAGPNLSRRNTHLLRRRDVDLDIRSLAQAQEHGGPLDRRDVELVNIARLAGLGPLKRGKREVFGDLVQTQVATP